MKLYMGIDAGGTKTDCAIGDGASLLGEATGESCKVAQVGNEEARRNLHNAILRTCQSARVAPRDLEQICIGISGASVPGNASWVQTVIHELVACEVQVIGDHIVAHHAAFGGGPGVLVIAGTGSIAYGINEHGEHARAGGWGAIASDQGSAFWIGREAVAESLLAFDSGRRDGMFTIVAQGWNVSTHDEVVRIANSGALSRFSELAKPVAEAADLGNPEAATIMARAGQELAELAGAVIIRLWPAEQVVRVAVAGGVLQGSVVVQKSFQSALEVKHPRVVVNLAKVRPVIGALAIALGRRETQ
ncbi:MAG TPA: BadF/BadG/BcrA/BcrD ATPase family protein [Candidatus Angelobacter sp.]|jgi:N-acetylglucosamine kinase-like BadF-type ATPase|nr:BadF/BadG/BcrA/BcrD ATPase family protein [Candidatus Angelobacter sp.]